MTTPIKLEEAKTTGLEVVANRADLRRDIHVFDDYVRTHEVKRGHRDNQLPTAHRQRLARLMSAPEMAAKSEEDPGFRWIKHVDAVCLALGFVRYDTKGIYAGYTSMSPSFPDNYIKFEEAKYERFLGLSLQEQEEQLLGVHLRAGQGPESEFFSQGPLNRLDTFDCWGSAIGVVATIRIDKVRRKLLDLLAECPSGVWFTARSLIDHLREHDPWFLIPERIPASVQERAMGSGRYANFIERKRGNWANRTPISDRDPEGFAKVEGRFVERFLEGIALVLGYVEVAYLKNKKQTEMEPSRGLLPAFRVTERLRPAMRGEIVAPKVTVLPNFEVHVESLFYPAKTEARVLRLGELTQRGIVTVVKLTKPKVAEAVAAEPEFKVEAELKALSGRELPENVGQELEEWTGHSEKFILYEGIGLLEGRREDVETGRFVTEEISPYFALVRSPKGLYEMLEAAGEIPVWVRHLEKALAAPSGVSSRLAKTAKTRTMSKKAAKLQRTVQTTLWFSDAEAHAEFGKMLLDAKCVVATDSRKLTVSYSRKVESIVNDCLKKLGKQYVLTVEDIEK